MVRILKNVIAGAAAFEMTLGLLASPAVFAQESRPVSSAVIDLFDEGSLWLTEGESVKVESLPYRYKDLCLELVPDWYDLPVKEDLTIDDQGIIHANKAGDYQVAYGFHFTDESSAQLEEKYPNNQPEFPSVGYIMTVHVSENPYVFRMYNPNSGEHFYTTSNTERSALRLAGWDAEAFNWKSETEDGKPIYRLYDPNAGDHLFTADPNEYQELVKYGWKQEGIAWQSSDDSKMPVYRLYNPNAKTGRHHMTSSQDEVKHLVSLGWKDEGICWYGVDPDTANAD